MKLRLRDNSIRFRLTQSEVAAMQDAGMVNATVTFADGNRLVYCLESSPACVDPVATFEGGEMLVRLPESMVQHWAASDEVSMASEQALGGGEVLSILVEKDFACLAPREGEDESDMFPHPEQVKANC
jgi:hypothetical protein